MADANGTGLAAVEAGGGERPLICRLQLELLSAERLLEIVERCRDAPQTTDRC